MFSLSFGRNVSTVFHNIIHIISNKLVNYRVNEWTVRCSVNWQNCWTQRLVITGMSRWRPVTCGIPQKKTLVPVLFIIFINDLQGRAECILSKFADAIKLGRVVTRPEDCASIQRDLDTGELC